MSLVQTEESKAANRMRMTSALGGLGGALIGGISGLFGRRKRRQATQAQTGGVGSPTSRSVSQRSSIGSRVWSQIGSR
jgi:LPXTG-motif cell wall-anchored protein